jgi:hypothetical protein
LDGSLTVFARERTLNIPHGFRTGVVAMFSPDVAGRDSVIGIGGKNANYGLLDTAFEPEVVEEMGHAYEDLRRDLQLMDRSDPFTHVVAKHVITLASSGDRSAG